MGIFERISGVFGSEKEEKGVDPRLLEIKRLEEEIAELIKIPEDKRSPDERDLLDFNQKKLDLLRIALEEESKKIAT
jgi:hypothetical protein